MISRSSAVSPAGCSARCSARACAASCPRARRPARAAPAAGVVALAACVGDGLVRRTRPAARRVARRHRAAATRDAATIRIAPRRRRRRRWVDVTAWQGRRQAARRPPGARPAPGVYRTTKPIPVTATWKAMIRVQNGRAISPPPVRMPGDAAIPAKEVPATAGSRARSSPTRSPPARAEARRADLAQDHRAADRAADRPVLRRRARLGRRADRRAPVSQPRPRGASPRTAATPLTH